MYFIIWKQKNKYRMQKSFKRKDKWKVVDYDNENYNKYWYQFIYIIRNNNVVVINKPKYLYILL